jgi:hydrogenase-4 component E
MITLLDVALSLVLLSVLSALASSRLPTLIRAVAFQGVVVSLAPLFLGLRADPSDIAFTVATLVIRGIAIPLSLYLAILRVAIRRDVEPIVSPQASLLTGLVLIVAATWAGHAFDLPTATRSSLLLATAITLLVAGMFLIMARRNAIAMVLGYIMLENGIYVVGTTFSVRTHHIVEFGILLDVLAGVMIMGVVLRNIKQTIDDVDTSLLRTLRE